MESADPIDMLVELFPRLFRGQRPGLYSTLPRGWFSLVAQLFGDLDRLFDDNNAARFEVRQIKEKTGRLRVHFWLGPPYDAADDASHREWFPMRKQLNERIQLAGDESEKTCARCGAGDASCRRHNEMVVLCDVCSPLQATANQLPESSETQTSDATLKGTT